MFSAMTCPICASDAPHYCSARILGKYDVQYFRCSQCRYLFTESPYWLDEAYDSAITKLDIGLVSRNEWTVPVVQAVINQWFDSKARFIDYGGGYGMMVRMLRDRGFDYYRQDIHCANLFAESFDIADVPPFRAELLTAFEVFEHLVDPVAEVEKMLALSDSILFSTTVQPTPDVNPDTWWYFTTDTGQHIALYSRESLRRLAERFGLNYYWSEKNIHLFTKKRLNPSVYKLITHPRLATWYNAVSPGKPTLLDKDFSFVQSKLKASFVH